MAASSERDRRLADLLPNSLAQASLGYDINGATQQVLEFQLNPRQIEETAARFQLNEHIHVAVFGRRTSCDRAEHSNVSRTTPTRDLFNLRPMLSKFMELHDGTWRAGVMSR
jgi:hypothetical protein